jgi:type IV secretory pathway component VirB8
MSESSSSKKPASADEIEQAIESGDYFAHALGWYRAQFVAPIAQRSWLVLAAGASVTAAIAAIFALFSLLPLTDRPAIPASQENILDYVISGEKLRKSGESRDVAILKFFVREYITRRESYAHARFENYERFVKAHSADDIYEEYERVYGRHNPRSLASVLGELGRRVIEIEQLDVDFVGARASAYVVFKASFFTVINLPTSRWKVKLRAYYRPMVVNEQVDVIGSDVALDIKPASFKVFKYELQKLP